MKCKCSMRIKLVGDGCEVCNPEYAAQFKESTINLAKKVADMKEDNTSIEEWAERLANDISKGND